MYNKWEEHIKTDKREKLIDEYEEKHGKLTSEQLEKVRMIYNSYEKQNKEFKIEYIDIIKSIIRERKKDDNTKDF